MIKTVGLILGPYRNLTTLLASNMSLHPNCQVLNHAGKRILKSRKTNFLIDYSDAKLNNFIISAIKYSQDTSMGWRGGTITSSHAYKRSPKQLFPNAYLKRFGHTFVKKDIKCLFWKESMMVTNVIRNNHIDMSNFLVVNPYARFIYPIRNPLDCAHSNVSHAGSIARICYNMQGYNMNHMVDFVLQQLFWGVELSHKHPNRIRLLFESDMNEKETWLSLADFFCLDRDEQWISDVFKCGMVEPKRQHYNKDTQDCYCAKVEAFFRNDYPEIADRLLLFVNGE